MDENERKNQEDPRDRFTPNNIFFLAVKLVAFSIILYVILTHLSDISAIVGSLLSLISPLLIGGLVALILNTPMMALEKLIYKIAGQARQEASARHLRNNLARADVCHCAAHHLHPLLLHLSAARRVCQGDLPKGAGKLPENNRVAARTGKIRHQHRSRYRLARRA